MTSGESNSGGARAKTGGGACAHSPIVRAVSHRWSLCWTGQCAVDWTFHSLSLQAASRRIIVWCRVGWHGRRWYRWSGRTIRGGIHSVVVTSTRLSTTSRRLVTAAGTTTRQSFTPPSSQTYVSACLLVLITTTVGRNTRHVQSQLVQRRCFPLELPECDKIRIRYVSSLRVCFYHLAILSCPVWDNLPWLWSLLSRCLIYFHLFHHSEVFNHPPVFSHFVEWFLNWVCLMMAQLSIRNWIPISFLNIRPCLYSDSISWPFPLYRLIDRWVGADRCKPNFNAICCRMQKKASRYLLPFEHNARTWLTDRQTTERSF